MRDKEITSSLIFRHFKKLTKLYVRDHTFILLNLKKKSLQQDLSLLLDEILT